MTALTKYARLEAAALWRASPDAQRKDVIVSIGDATLTITDTKDTAVAHWSLAAIVRANPGKRPAIFHPDGDPSETVELSTEEDEMIRAIEKLRHAIERARPQTGRLRGVLTASILAAIVAAGIVWMPDALIRQAQKVVPQVKRQELGTNILTRLERVTGAPCRAQSSLEPLVQFGLRLSENETPLAIGIVRNGVRGAVHLPGGQILLSRTLVEDFESPDVAAGFALAEDLRRAGTDPLRRFLESAGILTTLRLLTTGRVDAGSLDTYAADLLTAPQDPIDMDALLERFTAVQVPSSPYAYAIDPSGEATLRLIEGDPYRQGAPKLLLNDADWVRLQNICGG